MRIGVFASEAAHFAARLRDLDGVHGNPGYYGATRRSKPSAQRKKPTSLPEHAGMEVSARGNFESSVTSWRNSKFRHAQLLWVLIPFCCSCSAGGFMPALQQAAELRQQCQTTFYHGLSFQNAFQILCNKLSKFEIWSCSALAGSDPILVLLQCWSVHACTPAGTRAETTTPNHLPPLICSRMHFKSSVAADEIRNLVMLSFSGL